MHGIDNTAVKAYQDHAIKYSADVIGDLMYGFDTAKWARVRTGIKGDEVLTDISFNKLARRYKHTFTERAGQIVEAPRVISVTKAKVEVPIIPAEYDDDYRAHIIRNPGLDPRQWTLQKYIFDKIIEQTQMEMEDAVYGATKTGSPTDDDYLDVLFDGVLAIAAAEGTPVATGVTTAANAVENFNAIYKSLGPVAKRAGGVILCSDVDAELYAQAAYDGGRRHISDPENPTMDMPFLLNKKFTIKPVAGMAGSRRIIFTQKDNIIIGTGLLADAGKIFLDFHHRQIDLMIDFSLGVQIGRVSADRFAMNDQA